MHIENFKMSVKPASIIDRAIAPLVYLWIGLRIFVWGEGFIKVPFLVADDEDFGEDDSNE